MRVNLKVEQLLKVVEGKSSFSPSFFIYSIASLEQAQANDLTVVFDEEEGSVFDPVPIEKIEQSNAGLILASKRVTDNKNYIIVKDPLVAFDKLVRFVNREHQQEETIIHKSAIVDKSVVLEDGVRIDACAVIARNSKIGRKSKIGAQVYIGKECKIGSRVLIYPGVRILDYCVIGDDVIIHSGVVIGSDGFGYRVSKKGFHKIPHIGIVEIGNDVEIGAGTCIDRAEFNKTVIGDGVKIDNNVHIAHNVKIGSCTAILAQTGIAGSVQIGVACQIGGQVAIKDHVKIGNRVKIVSKSAVMKNLNDGEVVCGIPSMPFTNWKRLVVATLRLPDYIRLVNELRRHIDKLSSSGGFFKRLFR